MPVGGKPPSALSLSSLGEASLYQWIVYLIAKATGEAKLWVKRPFRGAAAKAFNDLLVKRDLVVKLCRE